MKILKQNGRKNKIISNQKKEIIRLLSRDIGKTTEIHVLNNKIDELIDKIFYIENNDSAKKELEELKDKHIKLLAALKINGVDIEVSQ